MKQKVADQLRGKKILIATVAADGHLNPLTGLAKYLSDAGCDVRWYTSGIYKEKFDRLGILSYLFVKAEDINGTTLNQIFPERNDLKDAGDKANFDMINVFINPGPDQYEDILEIRRSFRFDAVIADNMFPAVPYLSAKLDVPVMSVGIIPLAEDAEEPYPYGPGFYPPVAEEEHIRLKEIRAMFKDTVYKQSTDRLAGLLHDHDISCQGVNFFDIMTKAPDLYLQIGSPSFEYQRKHLGDNIRYIGALLPYSDPGKQTKWSSDKLKFFDKVVLVTQGTIENDTTKLIEPVLEAFSNTNTLVIAATGGFNTEKLRNQFPAGNVIIEDFIPFDQVMPHTDVFVTNGGYGGTLLAIQHQLPVVCAGLYEGKAEICARIGHLKYGIDLTTERPTLEQIEKAVTAAFNEPQYKANVIALSQELDNYDAQDLAATYLAELLRPDKLS